MCKRLMVLVYLGERNATIKQGKLKASEPWMQALINGKEGIDVEGIKQTLIDEGVTCIKDTDL